MFAGYNLSNHPSESNCLYIYIVHVQASGYRDGERKKKEEKIKIHIPSPLLSFLFLFLPEYISPYGNPPSPHPTVEVPSMPGNPSTPPTLSISALKLTPCSSKTASTFFSV